MRSRLLIGDEIGMLKLEEKFTKEENGKKRYYGRFSCQCGGEITTRTDAVIGKRVRSCGCLAQESFKENQKKRWTYYTAFGETKTIREWSEDPRCVVDYETLRGRLKRKEDVEKSITTPLLKTQAGKTIQIGDEIHRLTILEFKSVERYGQNITLAKCQCRCGNIITRKLANIVSGNTKSCGCLQSEVQSNLAKQRNFKHGKGDLTYRLYRIWCGMIARCHKPYSTEYRKYGGNGITVCKEWHDFTNFEKWALSNGYRDDLTIHRKNNGNYCPEECSWEDYNTQNNEKSNNVYITAWGERKTLAQWSRDERCKVKPGVIKYRVNNGWQPENAISIPPLKDRWAGEPVKDLD